MSWLKALPIVGDIIDKVIPDSNARAEAKENLAKMAVTQEGEELMNRFGVIQAEAKSEHWIVAAWRPITMLVFVFIIANNYILAPYIALLFSVDVVLELPPQMWDLLKIGLGGYVVGRSTEKVAKMWKGKD